MKSIVSSLVAATMAVVFAGLFSSCGSHPRDEEKKPEALGGSVEGLTRRLFSGGRLNLLVYGPHKAQDLTIRDGVDRFASKDSSLYSVMTDTLEKFQKQGDPNVWILQFSTSDGRVLRLSSFKSAVAWRDNGEVVWGSSEDVVNTIKKLYGQEPCPPQPAQQQQSQQPAAQPQAQPQPAPSTTKPTTPPIQVPVPVQPVPVPATPQTPPPPQGQSSGTTVPVPPGFGMVR